MELVTDKITHLWEGYKWTLTQADERVEDWLLMRDYYPTLCLTGLYLLFVWLVPKFMQRREPFQLKWTLFVYNMSLVVMNFHICSELFTATWRLGYSYSCQKVSYTYDPDEMRVAKALWWYYFSKLVEFLDTVFFIMRKKNNQVSFLHVYHHATMFPIWWIGVKWVAGGQSFFGAMINSFIHVIMYTYYGVAALGPEYQKYLWWKKYLTRLQLVQFFIGMIYATQSIFIDCEYPKWMQYTALGYGATMIILFLNYYYQTYSKPRPQVQFIVGMAHAAQSLLVGCPYPLWMQWALILYGMSILLLFLNFYFHAYIKPRKPHKKVSKDQSANGYVASNGKAVANGADAKKDQ